MPLPAFAIPLAISGISALAGLFGNRKSKQQQEQQQTTTTNQLTAPEYDDKTLYMRNLLMNQFMDRTRLNDDFFSGYANEGLNTINEGANAANAGIENILASRGLGGTSAGASALVQNQIARARQQNQLLNQIPLLRDQRAQENLAKAGGFFASLPVPTRTTGTSTGTGTSTVQQPGNMLGGIFGGLGTALAGLYGQGAFGGAPAQGPYRTNGAQTPAPNYPGTVAGGYPVFPTVW